MATDGDTKTVAGRLQQPHVRLTVEMALLLLGAELTRTLPLPWRVAGLLFSLLAVVQGIRALRAIRAYRRGNRDGLVPAPTGGVLVLVGVIVAVLLTVVQLVMLAAYPLVQDQQSCRDRALTRTAAERCDDQLADRLQELSGLDVPGS